jgi:hypothetical protein
MFCKNTNAKKQDIDPRLQMDCKSDWCKPALNAFLKMLLYVVPVERK